jgi:shikimate O-hydroxycinnamoyltransferase
MYENYRALDFIDRVNPFFLTRANAPLARFRLTQLRGGGSVLGLSLSHGLADGVSYYQFIHIWSLIHEGLPWTPPVPGHDLLVCNPDRQHELFGSQDRLPPACSGFRCLTLPEFLVLGSNFLLQQRNIVTKTIPFTRRQLNAIKRSVVGSPGRLSMNDALCAHLWQTLARTGGVIRPGRQYKMLTIASLRGRGALGVPQHFFGNAVTNMLTQLPGEEIIEADIAHLASQCRRALEALDDRDVLRQMLWLRHQEQHGRLPRVMADVDLFGGDCVISSMFRLPVDEAVFDGQRPSRKAYTVVPAPWVIWLKPWWQEQGGIEIHAHVPRSFADRLQSEPVQEALYRFGEADDDK